ncbi:MAG: gliding motility lipoprotein GldH [Chitinophagia bacterium]|nr:gliding motility lipoprotein GldH [Chitinophagia bacterium]
MRRASRWLAQSIVWLSVLCIIEGCTQLELYEKSVPLAAQRWENTYRPTFDFIIKDTTARYDVALVLRHRDRYHYNNIWLRISVTDPQGKNYSFETDLLLGTNEKGWLGAGMDDIYEHRISLQKELLTAGVSFRQAGTYRFSIEQVMREDPLEEVMNVGLRIEKKP